MEALLLLIIAVVVIAMATAIGPRLKIAGPLIIVVIGLGVSLLPFVPAIEVDPEIILVGVLPPLLYSAAVSLPAIEFRRDFRPIAGLSVLLVVLSSIALGLFFAWAIPGLGVYLAIAIGAILSPTDAVATSIVKRLGISRRVTTLLEGESLLNDATSLVILRTAVAAFAAGSVGPGAFVGAFAWGVVVAAAVGAIVGYVTLRLRALIRNPAANTAIGLVVPFAAYLPTEQLGGSGLVAAVVAGIVTGQGATRRFTPEQRKSDEQTWRTAELLLEGGVFLIMGLELKELLIDNVADHQSVWPAVMFALAALGIILVVRSGYVAVLVWLNGRRARDKQRQRLAAFSEHIDHAAAATDAEAAARSAGRGAARADPAKRQARLAAMRRRITRAAADLDYYQASPLGWKHGTVIVWAGMRGVVTLAAAQTLPRDTPDRSLLVLTAFLVAVGSLMLQGFTLPWLVRMLRIRDGTEDAVGGREMRRLDDELRRAAASALSSPTLRRRDGGEFPAELLRDVGERLTEPPDDDATAAAREALELRLVLIRAMRQRLVHLSADGTYSTAVLRHALAELDADELSLLLRLRGDD